MKLLCVPAIALFLPIASGTTPGLSPGATIELGSYLQCVHILDSRAIPVTGEMTGNGGSSFQLFQDREGIVYASWSLKTNNLNNGADNWVFGIELDDVDNEFAFTATSYVEPLQMGNCRKVGSAPMAAFEYYVDAGAGGWSGASSCTVGFSWSLTLGVVVSLTNAAGSVSTTLGMSASCTDGVNFDSESLIRGKGKGSVACLACLDQVLP